MRDFIPQVKPKAAEPTSLFSERQYCDFEPIPKRIESIRVLIVNCLLRYATDLSEVAKNELGQDVKSRLSFERKISSLACDNIAQNVIRLVLQPKTLTVHLSEIAEAASDWRPDAIVMSGTYSDFDYYSVPQLDSFRSFIKETKIPVLAICGSHQLVAMSFGSELTTLDNLPPAAKRNDRLIEYQYRFIKIVDTTDPIFEGIDDRNDWRWQKYTRRKNILRVWQNHGIQVVGVPQGFHLLATSYLCRNQMMVRRSDGQLIYSVQFHLEKSFEDWSRNPTRWEHPNESKDGRLLFENFLKLALQHQK
jgi:GMP synthase-like glutamine amidotransferase